METRTEIAINDLTENEWVSDGGGGDRVDQAEFWLERVNNNTELNELLYWLLENWGIEDIPEAFQSHLRLYREGDVVVFKGDDLNDAEERGVVVENQDALYDNVIIKWTGSNHNSFHDYEELQLVYPAYVPAIVPESMAEKAGHPGEGDTDLDALDEALDADYWFGDEFDDLAVDGLPSVPTYVDEHPSVADMVNHPPHYNQHPKGIECIDIIEANPFANLAFAMKYLWRVSWGSKGNDIEDLQKAVWFIEREIGRRNGKS